MLNEHEAWLQGDAAGAQEDDDGRELCGLTGTQCADPGHRGREPGDGRAAGRDGCGH